MIDGCSPRLDCSLSSSFRVHHMHEGSVMPALVLQQYGWSDFSHNAQNMLLGGLSKTAAFIIMQMHTSQACRHHNLASTPRRP